jgi:hypothetical protein
MYEHYWKNTGESKEFDYEKAYSEDSGVRAGVDQEIVRAQAAAEELIRAGNANFSMTGQASAVPDEYYPRTENWRTGRKRSAGIRCGVMGMFAWTATP